MDEKINWRKLLGTAALAGTTALTPMKAHGQQVPAPLAQALAADPQAAMAKIPLENWERELNRQWQQFNDEQKQALKQDQLNWIRWKDRLPPEKRIAAIQARLQYFARLESDVLAGEQPEAAPTPEPTPQTVPGGIRSRAVDVYGNRGPGVRATPPPVQVQAGAEPSELPFAPVYPMLPVKRITMRAEPQDGRAPMPVISSWIENIAPYLRRHAQDIKVIDIQYAKPFQDAQNVVYYPVRVVFVLYGVAPALLAHQFVANDVRLKLDLAFSQDFEDWIVQDLKKMQ